MMYRKFGKAAGIHTCPNCHMAYHVLAQSRGTVAGDCHLCSGETKEKTQDNYVCQGCATYVHPTMATYGVEFSRAA